MSMWSKLSESRHAVIGTAAITCSIASFYPGFGIPFGLAALVLGKACLGTAKQRARGYVAIFVAVVGLGTNIMLLRTAYLFTHMDR